MISSAPWPDNAILLPSTLAALAIVANPTAAPSSSRRIDVGSPSQTMV